MRRDSAHEVLQRCKGGDEIDEILPRCEYTVPTFGGCRAISSTMSHVGIALNGFNRRIT
jgi:hypothetical protein